MLINFKNPLLSSEALQILIKILLFAAGLICGRFVFENNLEIFSHHFKKNSFYFVISFTSSQFISAIKRI